MKSSISFVHCKAGSVFVKASGFEGFRLSLKGLCSGLRFRLKGALSAYAAFALVLALAPKIADGGSTSLGVVATFFCRQSDGDDDVDVDDAGDNDDDDRVGITAACSRSRYSSIL